MGFASFDATLGSTLGASFGGVLRPTSFACLRDFNEVLAFGNRRPPARGAGRFLLWGVLRDVRFAPLRRGNAGFLRVVRAARVDRRAGRLPVRAALAVGRALLLALAPRFLAGLEDFLAMAVLLVWAPANPRHDPVIPRRWGHLGKTQNCNISLPGAAPAPFMFREHRCRDLPVGTPERACAAPRTDRRRGPSERSP